MHVGEKYATSTTTGVGATMAGVNSISMVTILLEVERFNCVTELHWHGIAHADERSAANAVLVLTSAASAGVFVRLLVGGWRDFARVLFAPCCDVAQHEQLELRQLVHNDYLFLVLVCLLVRKKSAIALTQRRS